MWPLHNQSYCNISMKNGKKVITKQWKTNKIPDYRNNYTIKYTNGRKRRTYTLSWLGTGSLIIIKRTSKVSVLNYFYGLKKMMRSCMCFTRVSKMPIEDKHFFYCFILITLHVENVVRSTHSWFFRCEFYLC
jgi:hypothetical protein